MKLYAFAALGMSFLSPAFAQSYQPQFQIKAPPAGILWDSGGALIYLGQGLFPYSTIEGLAIINYITGTCQPPKPNTFNPGPTPAQQKAGQTEGCAILIAEDPNSPQMFTSEPSYVDEFAYAATAYQGYTSDGAQKYECLYEITMQWNQSATYPTDYGAGTCKMTISASVVYLPEGGVKLPGHGVQCIAGTNSNVISETSNGNACNGLTLTVTPVTTP